MSFLIAAFSLDARRRVATNEGPCIGEEDLREVQSHQPPWGGSGDLRERKAQAAPGLGSFGRRAELHAKFVVLSFRRSTMDLIDCELRTENYELRKGLVSLSQGLR